MLIETNPADHLHEVTQHKQDATQKPPFTKDDLIKIFPATYGNEFQRVGTPDPVKLTARFWIPLLALFSGARVEELCQLKADDIGRCVETGTPFYQITNEGEAHDGRAKTLKNKNSVRLIPIHQTLIDIGFLRFVEERRSEDGESAGLFALQRSDGQRMGKHISSWFSRMEKREKADGGMYYVGGYIESQGVETKARLEIKTGPRAFTHSGTR